MSLDKSAIERLIENSTVIRVTVEELEKSRREINPEMEKWNEENRCERPPSNIIIGGCQ